MAYAAIVTFLILLLAVVLRTLMMYATLTLMPLARILRWIERLLGRGRP